MRLWERQPSPVAGHYGILEWSEVLTRVVPPTHHDVPTGASTENAFLSAPGFLGSSASNEARVDVGEEGGRRRRASLTQASIRSSTRVGQDRPEKRIRSTGRRGVHETTVQMNYRGLSFHQAPSATLAPAHPADPPYETLERSRTFHQQQQ